MLKSCAVIARILATSMLLNLAGPAAAQQDYPNKPIRFIVPFATGGGTTAVARLVAQRFTQSWGQQVIVDNRPGGNSIIGTEAAAKSAPDGYTILLVNLAFVTTSLLSATPYDPLADFAPVAAVTSTEYILVLHPSVPANTLHEFIALAKSKPGQLNYSSSGSAGSSHLSTEVLCMMTGITMQHIPYKGAAPALTDLVGGQVQALLSPPVNAGPHIRNGKLKAIAITGATRFAGLPQVPTFAESGLPGFDEKAWQAIVAPARTPKAIIDKLSTEIARFLAEADAREKLLGQGLDPFISSPEKFAAMLKADTVKYARVIKAGNIKLDN